MAARSACRTHEVSRKCHGMSRSVTKCHRGFSMSQNVSELSPTVTKVSPKCHGMSRNVSKCHEMSQSVTKRSPMCHDMSPSVTQLSLPVTTNHGAHHGHCRCDMTLLGWGVSLERADSTVPKSEVVLRSSYRKQGHNPVSH